MHDTRYRIEDARCTMRDGLLILGYVPYSLRLVEDPVLFSGSLTPSSDE